MPGGIPDDPGLNRFGMTQRLSAPVISVNVDGTPLVGRKRAVEISEGQQAGVILPVVNSAGEPVTLADLQSPAAVVRVRDSSVPTGDAYLEFPANVDDPTNGLVSFTIDTSQTGPGIFDADLGVYQGTDLMVVNRIWIVVARSLFGSRSVPGVPTIAEIRLALRDSVGAENVLLDQQAFDSAEIAMAMTRAVDIWNEEPPPVAAYTLDNFPFRARLVDATIGLLYRTLGLQEARNWRNINAAGMTVSGPDRSQFYLAMAKDMLDDYREWVRRQKLTINASRGWGCVPSGYSYL